MMCPPLPGAEPAPVSEITAPGVGCGVSEAMLAVSGGSGGPPPPSLGGGGAGGSDSKLRLSMAISSSLDSAVTIEKKLIVFAPPGNETATCVQPPPASEASWLLTM